MKKIVVMLMVLLLLFPSCSLVYSIRDADGFLLWNYIRLTDDCYAVSSEYQWESGGYLYYESWVNHVETPMIYNPQAVEISIRVSSKSERTWVSLAPYSTCDLTSIEFDGAE